MGWPPQGGTAATPTSLLALQCRPALHPHAPPLMLLPTAGIHFIASSAPLPPHSWPHVPRPATRAPPPNTPSSLSRPNCPSHHLRNTTPASHRKLTDTPAPPHTTRTQRNDMPFVRQATPLPALPASRVTLHSWRHAFSWQPQTRPCPLIFAPAARLCAPPNPTHPTRRGERQQASNDRVCSQLPTVHPSSRACCHRNFPPLHPCGLPPTGRPPSPRPPLLSHSHPLSCRPDSPLLTSPRSQPPCNQQNPLSLLLVAPHAVLPLPPLVPCLPQWQRYLSSFLMPLLRPTAQWGIARRRCPPPSTLAPLATLPLP